MYFSLLKISQRKYADLKLEAIESAASGLGKGHDSQSIQVIEYNKPAKPSILP